MADACYCDDLEYPTVFDERDVMAAREAHECTECHRAILPGESYKRIWGVWPTIDGAMTHLVCARCMVLKEFIEAHIPCACIPFGEMLSYARIEIEEAGPEARILVPELEALMADIQAQPAYKPLQRGDAPT